MFQLYHGGQFYWWKKSEYLEKTTDLLQVTDKLLYRVHLAWAGFELTKILNGREISNYYVLEDL
jgi:hypothetical protein